MMNASKLVQLTLSFIHFISYTKSFQSHLPLLSQSLSNVPTKICRSTTCFTSIDNEHNHNNNVEKTRKQFMIQQLVAPIVGTLAVADDANAAFQSSGYGKEEYTNSITASRDTNISPKEAYDTISSNIMKEPAKAAATEIPRALDLGAGAGVSTQLLYEMGYKYIDAVDWSSEAWNKFVEGEEETRKTQNSLSSQDKKDFINEVRFYEMDDETFRTLWRAGRTNRNDQTTNPIKYDAVFFNFAVNERKAKQYAREFLTPNTGRLLAPVNVQNDYWGRQNYRAYDSEGNVLLNLADVGAWTVQFQPDVTQDSCQGIWCPPFNGFVKKKITGI